MMAAKIVHNPSRVFYRCDDETIAYDVAIQGLNAFELDRHGMCPRCEKPLAEHHTFTLTFHEADTDEAQAA